MFSFKIYIRIYDEMSLLHHCCQHNFQRLSMYPLSSLVCLVDSDSGRGWLQFTVLLVLLHTSLTTHVAVLRSYLKCSWPQASFPFWFYIPWFSYSQITNRRKKVLRTAVLANLCTIISADWLANEIAYDQLGLKWLNKPVYYFSPYSG
jgi:hypothetical protein